jgi:ATP phosphoribosyltransferase
MLKIAIQKSGRLHDDTIALLKQCGLKVNKGLDQLKAEVSGFPAEVLFLRNSDIPQYVADGVADIAVLGENTVIEKGKELTTHEHLGFSKCRLSIAVPKGNSNYKTIKSLEGKKIATSYPNTLRQYLEKERVNAEIHQISGSVEIAPNIGLSDAICDLVSSGSTLFKNNLIEKDIILKSEAVLVSRSSLGEENEALLEQLLFRIRSVLGARKFKYILMNVPNDKLDEVSSILPVLKSPTVLPLMEEGWSSLHSVIASEDFWGVINQLKACGAEGILVCPIEKMVV